MQHVTRVRWSREWACPDTGDKSLML